ncbi:glycosyltransferase [Vibrio sp. PNB22_4_1]|uniref:glycosyltransferase n=1 Tax=unclassified Vibrio TaxID=2614977 RepID=UPI00406A3E0F
MKKILAVVPGATDEHFFKDVFQFPIKIAKTKGAKLTFLSKNEIRKNLLDTSDVLELMVLKGDQEPNELVRKYIESNAKEFDTLILFHVRSYSLEYALLYLKINGRGKVVIKADRGDVVLKSQGVLRKGFFRRFYERALLKKFKPGQLTVSYETDLAKTIAEKKLPKAIEVIRTYNGHNVDRNRDIIPFHEKSNVLLVVGSVGDKNKNHVLIIEAIKMLLESDGILLSGWKLKFAGPIVNEEFVDKINDLSKFHSFFGDSVELLGSLSKDELYDLYDKSKYMIISSKREGSPLIVPESLRFGNVILSTPVSSVPELINGCGYIADGFSKYDMYRMIKSALVNVDINAEKSKLAYLRGLELNWDDLD